MSNNHILIRNIGNLRGFSTDSSFVRPSNVAEVAVNIQRGPDESLQLRRGYQCQIAQIGGLGIGTFDDPENNTIKTVTLDLSGQLYNKLTKQIYFYYDGQVTGVITGASQANPASVTSNGHGLVTGTKIIIRDIVGMTQLNNHTYTITSTGANTFTLNGVNSTSYTAYISGGSWSIAFADQRYLNFTIFTDPRYLVTNPGWSVQQWSLSPWGAPSGESITCNITANRAAQIAGNQTNVNTINVEFGHDLAASDVVVFYTTNGMSQQRTVLSTTTSSITIVGYPVSVTNAVYIGQFFDIPFRKGFDVSDPYLISTFISTITDSILGIYGLKMSINGDSDYPAAFLQIVEPIIIDGNSVYTIDYWYWGLINHTVTIPFVGASTFQYQNSPDFEVASMAAYDDVIYIADGVDYPQKYDGQTVYRAGMPKGERPSATDNTGATIKPFSDGEVYTYAITYEQIDHVGHVVEGEVSQTWAHHVGSTSATDVTVTNIQPSSGWNTDGAIATGGASTSYGPDVNGFYYDAVDVTAGYTLKIDDTAYYKDITGAVIDGDQGPKVILNVGTGHAIVSGDVVYFNDSTPNDVNRIVSEVSDTTITISGAPVTVTNGTRIRVYKVSVVFGDVGIVDGNQSNINTINIISGHTIRLSDVVSFTDSSNRVQRRSVTGVTSTSVTISGIAVSVNNLILIASENQRSGQINLQRENANPITFYDSAKISNNLRINIYRTVNNGDVLHFVASIPNNSDGTSVQVFLDDFADVELGATFIPNIDFPPNPPPISKYLKAFGSQMLYGGGAIGNPFNSDNVFFSDGNFPEYVSLARNFFSVPNADDDVTGLGVAGTTLIVTKQQSLWAISGDLLTSQYQVTQISPGSNIGCIANATIQSVGSLLYFLHTNGVYAISENQIFPTDAFGNPIAISDPIDSIFRETPYLPQTRFVFKRSIAVNYSKDNQYWLFMPCEDVQSTIRTANQYSSVFCYDYQGKNWFQFYNINAASGFAVIDQNLYFQERRYSGVDGNTANLYKQHRFYRLVDHADHAGPQRIEWKSSWEDLGQPEMRKKFCRCILLMDRLSELQQYNNPDMYFSSYLNRITNLQNTIAKVTTVDNIRNSTWSYSGWGWNYWSGYQDTFVAINLRGGTVAKSIQVGFTIQGINMDIKFAGFQYEVIPENRRTIVR